MINHVSQDARTAQHSRCDVAIIGGGLVGASLACALAPLGLEVALLEAQEPGAGSTASFDDRALALSESSCRIFQGLGIWSLLESVATPIREIRVTERGRWGKVVLDPAELGLDRFGHVVEARLCGAALMKSLGGFGNVEFISPARIQSVQVGASDASVQYFRNGQPFTLAAQLLVGADGAESVVRKSLGIEEDRHDYRQTAVICNITTSLPHRGVAFECITPTGPFALLPHSEGRSGLVWGVAAEDAPAILALSDRDFREQAQALFGNALGPWLKVGRRSAYPLKLVRAREDFRSRAVLVGNAAHAIHPIGAQGFNLGLRDVAVLAELITDSFLEKPEDDIGRPDLLKAYSEWREQDQDGTTAFSDGLARLYANPSMLAAVARKTGLIAHALLPSMRRQMALRAMGYRGKVPRLALGGSLTTP